MRHLIAATTLALFVSTAASVQARTQHPDFSIIFVTDPHGGLAFKYDAKTALYSVEGTGDLAGTPGIAPPTPVRLHRFGTALAITLGVATSHRAATMFVSYPIASGGIIVTYQKSSGGDIGKTAIDNYNVVTQ